MLVQDSVSVNEGGKLGGLVIFGFNNLFSSGNDLSTMMVEL